MRSEEDDLPDVDGQVGIAVLEETGQIVGNHTNAKAECIYVRRWVFKLLARSPVSGTKWVIRNSSFFASCSQLLAEDYNTASIFRTGGTGGKALRIFNAANSTTARAVGLYRRGSTNMNACICPSA